MIRVALYILLVGIVAFGAAWLADRPGDLVLNWQGWHIQMSVMVAAVAILVIVFAIMLAWAVIRRILHGPTAVSGFFRERRQTRGYRTLSRGMIAAGAGDARLARHAAKEAGKLLRDEPLTLLLEAQAAQLAGDRDAARAAFEAMSERPDTELLGLRGLFIEAQRADDAETARQCIERAAKRAPGLGWAANALLDMQTGEGDWESALATVERNGQHRLIDKKAAKRARAVLLTAKALELEDGEPDRALTLALEAHKLAPELVPAAVVAARQSSAVNNTRQATRVIEKTWKLSPHPDLAEVYAHARSGDSARDRLKRAKALLQKMPNNEEGHIAVATVAIESRDWAEARAALEPLARSAPSQRICLLMADIAEGETGDAGKVREWLARAVRAPHDPAWTADGYVSEQWAPVSPISGHLDAFEWKVPVEAISAPVEEPEAISTGAETPAFDETPTPMIEARTAAPDSADPTHKPVAARTDDTAIAATPEPAPAAVSEEPPAKAETGVVTPLREAASQSVMTSTNGSAEAASSEDGGSKDGPSREGDAKEAASEAKAGTDTDTDAEPAIALDHLPDDPGPLPDEEADQAPKRRFGLF